MPAEKRKPTEDERLARNEKQRDYEASIRLWETSLERDARKAKQCAKNTKIRKKRTPEQRAAVNARMTLVNNIRLQNETKDKRDTRLANQKVLNKAAKLRETPADRDARLAKSGVYNEAVLAAKNAKLAARWKETGRGLSTEFGLGERSHADEIAERVHDIAHSSAGVFHPNGEATSDNWVQDHGEYMSLIDVIKQGCWAVYFYITITDIEPGTEIKCPETTQFLVQCHRNPIWRILRTGIGTEQDLERFSGIEARSVVRPYLLAECVSAFDVTSLEGGLQHYIEDELGLAPGMCLHKRAGAGSRLQYSTTKKERKRIDAGHACIYSLSVSFIKTTSRTFADTNILDPGRPPRLISCTAISHDGEQIFNVCVQGKNNPFPDTKSVVADKASNKATFAKNAERHRERKEAALAIGSEDDDSDIDGLDEQWGDVADEDMESADDEIETNGQVMQGYVVEEMEE
jgi:hypothetical protein